MFNKKLLELVEKLGKRVNDLMYKLADLKSEYITCDKCGARILKEKAIKGKDEIREYEVWSEPSNIFSVNRTEKYIYTPYYCIHCKKK